MKYRFGLKFTLLFGLVITVVNACGPSSAAEPVSTEVVQIEASFPDAVDSPTVENSLSTATNMPDPTQTAQMPTETASQTQQPTATTIVIPSPVETATAEIRATDRQTSIPVPTLDRTLSLQSPYLEGQDVLALQEQLLLLGYTQVGNPDGVFGGMTDAAVKQFQVDQELVVDGIVGQQTWHALFSIQADTQETPVSGGSVSFYLGTKSSEVKEINDRLQELGYSNCEPDRYFGAQTEFAVRQFQSANALEADGIVGPKTRDLLFSENAIPAPLPELQANFSSPIEVGSSYDLAYDGKNLWVARNDFGTQNDALSRIDPVSGTGISRIVLDELDGGSRHLHPILVYPAKDILWVGGRANMGTETGIPTIVAIKTSGKLLGDPIYVGTNNIEVSEVVGFFSENNTVWAVVNEPHTVLYAMSASPVKTVRRLALNNIYNATGAAFDGTTLWLAASKDDSVAVWAVNLENGAAGKVLGVCAEKLSFDGKWVWALQQNQIVAVDPESRQVMSNGDVRGWPRAITSNGKNQIWILTSYNADTFFQSLKTR